MLKSWLNLFFTLNFFLNSITNFSFMPSINVCQRFVYAMAL
jgi:hypothetical protein